MNLKNIFLVTKFKIVTSFLLSLVTLPLGFFVLIGNITGLAIFKYGIMIIWLPSSLLELLIKIPENFSIFHAITGTTILLVVIVQGIYCYMIASLLGLLLRK